MNIIILASYLPISHSFYIIAIIWQLLCMILRCVGGCVVPLCAKLCLPYGESEERCIMTCCLTNVLLFVEFIIQIIMLIANLVVVYTVDNHSNEVSVGFGWLISGSVCVFVLVCLFIHLYAGAIFISESCGGISESCGDIGECCRGVGECCEDGIVGCSRAVTRCCKLCHRRERQVERHDVPQTEPVPPYDTIEMLPVNESQMEPVPPYDTIEMLPVNESQMEPVPPFVPTEEIVYLNQPAAEPEPIYDSTGVNTPVYELQMEPEPPYTYNNQQQRNIIHSNCQIIAIM